PYLYCEHDPINMLDPSGHWWAWIDKLIDPVVKAIEGAPGGSAGVALRGGLIFAPIWWGGWKASKHFKDWMGHRKHGSQGDLYGNSHKHQTMMIRQLSDPD